MDQTCEQTLRSREGAGTRERDRTKVLKEEGTVYRALTSICAYPAITWHVLLGIQGLDPSMLYNDVLVASQTRIFASFKNHCYCASSLECALFLGNTRIVTFHRELSERIVLEWCHSQPPRNKKTRMDKICNDRHTWSTRADLTDGQ